MRSVSDFETNDPKCSVKKYVESVAILDYETVHEGLHQLFHISLPLLPALVVFNFNLWNSRAFFWSDRKCTFFSNVVFIVVTLSLFIICGCFAMLNMVALGEQAQAMETLYEQIDCFSHNVGSGDTGDWYIEMFTERCATGQVAAIIIFIAYCLNILPFITGAVLAFRSRNLSDMQEKGFDCCAYETY